MKHLFTLYSLLRALMEHGQHGLALAWSRHTGKPLDHRSDALTGQREDGWQPLLALGLGVTGMVWLIFIAACQYHQVEDLLNPGPTCQIEVPSTEFSSPHPIPLNLQRLSHQLERMVQEEGNLPEGKAFLLVKIDAQGYYQRHQVLYSTHCNLEQAVVKQLPRLVCLPAREGDRSVAAWIPVHIRVGQPQG